MVVSHPSGASPDDRAAVLPLRIATFNIENFGDGVSAAGSLSERIQVLRPQLVRLRADILCLQEVDSQRRLPGKTRDLGALDALLADTPYAGYERLTTTSKTKGSPRDKHNLVILSRFPMVQRRQIYHDLMRPPAYRPLADPHALVEVCWDRPILHAAVALGEQRTLHVVNVHLRAPRAAYVAGEKASGRVWRSMAGWAEGFFLAAVKRAGQALEARLLVEALFETATEPLIAVCGDFNADLHELPVRTIRGDEEDAGNPHLVYRTLVPVDRSLADSRRFSVVHHGRPQMLDHVLVSRSLLAWFRSAEVHNEVLGDELVTPQTVLASPESFHAPVVAEFHLGVPASAGSDGVAATD